MQYESRKSQMLYPIVLQVIPLKLPEVRFVIDSKFVYKVVLKELRVAFAELVLVE